MKKYKSMVVSAPVFPVALTSHQVVILQKLFQKLHIGTDEERIQAEQIGHILRQV